MTEEDFIRAELCMVPAAKARFVGFDRAFIGSYGHDDRVCAYPALTGLLCVEKPVHTLLTVLADKEEIGSYGVSGMQCRVFDDLFEAICRAKEADPAAVRAASLCLSADVGAAFDPNYAEVFEKRNTGYLNGGVLLSKYTGARGKSGSSDASAEFVGRVCRMLDDAGVVWQMGELGKVDQGGGGTVALFLAKKNIDTIDVGVPVLSMHAPWEIVSKYDVYMEHKAVEAFNRG